MEGKKTMSVCRGLRGATVADQNSRESIALATRQLLEDIVEANSLDVSQIAAIFFTTTSDLNAEFPALAARQLGWSQLALMCGHEMAVPDGLPHCIRTLILVNTDKGPEELIHVYLKGTDSLRHRGTSS